MTISQIRELGPINVGVKDQPNTPWACGAGNWTQPTVHLLMATHLAAQGPRGRLAIPSCKGLATFLDKDVV